MAKKKIGGLRRVAYSRIVTNSDYKSQNKSIQVIKMLEEYTSEAQCSNEPSLVRYTNDNGYYPLNNSLMKECFQGFIRELTKQIKNKKPSITRSKIASTSKNPLSELIADYFKKAKKKRPKTIWARHRLSKTLPIWRDTIDEVQVIYYQRALDEQEYGIPFTLDFGESVVLQAMKNTLGIKDYLHRHLSRHLNRGFGDKIDFWFVVEISKGGKLHLHGSVALDENDEDQLIEILKKASKSTDKIFLERHAVDINSYSRFMQGGFGWSLYCLKDFDRSRKWVSETKLITATTRLTRKAKWLYKKERKLMNDFIYYQLDR